MNTYSRILAIIDPTKESQKALSRAIELAKKTGASVTALMVIYDFSYEMTTMLSGEERNLMRNSVVADREHWLNDIIEQYCDDVSQLRSKVLWHNRPYEAIIKTVLNHDYDIVVKATHQHDTLKSVIFTPTDWHLLRKCPSPLLLVKEHEWPSNSQVLAAINSSCEEEAHKSLNVQIIQETKQIAELLGSEAILANCYPGTTVNLAIEIPEFDPVSYSEAIEKHHVESLKAYAEQFAIDETNCIVKEGLAEDMIPILAKEIDAELVVLGTVGRTGLSAALIGNTAEHMLDAIDCDVLALKPDGFVSPLATED